VGAFIAQQVLATSSLEASTSDSVIVLAHFGTSKTRTVKYNSLFLSLF